MTTATARRLQSAISSADWLALLEEETARLQAQGHHVAISFATTPPSIRSSTRPLSIAFADMLRDGARLL